MVVALRAATDLSSPPPPPPSLPPLPSSLLPPSQPPSPPSPPPPPLPPLPPLCRGAGLADGLRADDVMRRLSARPSCGAHWPVGPRPKRYSAFDDFEHGAQAYGRAADVLYPGA
eukprot:6184549-Pleurochrysis_carterae.AAC.1